MMKRIKINWGKLDKILWYIVPLVICAAIIAVTFLLLGFSSPITWVWTTSTLSLLFVIYGIALLVESGIIIKNKKTFRLIWAILGIAAGCSAVIFSDLTQNLLTGMIVIPSLAVFYISGLKRINKGS